MDPRVELARRIPVGELLLLEDHLDREAFQRSEIYCGFLARYDLGATISGIAHMDASMFVALGIRRSLAAKPLTRKQRWSVHELAPHFARAARIRQTLADTAATRRGLAAALDRLTRAVLLVDRQLRVLFANRCAETVLAERDGLDLERERLVAAHPPDIIALRLLVAGTAGVGVAPGSAGGYLRVGRPSSRRPLELLVTPLVPELGALALTSHPACVVFVVDPERVAEVASAALQRLHGLTAAEARLAALLCEGLGAAQAVERLRIGRETAKTELRSIFAKTGTRRQVQLVRRLTSGLAAVAVEANGG